MLEPVFTLLLINSTITASYNGTHIVLPLLLNGTCPDRTWKVNKIPYYVLGKFAYHEYLHAWFDQVEGLGMNCSCHHKIMKPYENYFEAKYLPWINKGRCLYVKRHRQAERFALFLMMVYHNGFVREQKGVIDEGYYCIPEQYSKNWEYKNFGW